MKTSVVLLLTDILPKRRRFYNRIIKSKLFDNTTPEKVFSDFKKNGIDGIELLLPTFVRSDHIDEIKKLTANNHIQVFSVHQALRFFTQTNLTEIIQLFDMAKKLSAKVIVLHMNSAGKQVFNPGYINAIHSLQKKYRIQVGFENREKYLGSIMNSYGWDGSKFSELMKKEDFHITLDVCHLGQAGGDIIEFFKENKDRIVNIHLSDYRSSILNSSLRPMRYKHLPLGKGTLPIREFIRLLRKENYKGILTMEITSDLNNLLESAKFVKNTY